MSVSTHTRVARDNAGNAAKLADANNKRALEFMRDAVRSLADAVDELAKRLDRLEKK
jgi:ubiquinone biosynthesis protein UbiJ